MSTDRHVKLIEELLQKSQPRNFSTPQELLAWQRGFLTGLLAVMMKDDNFNHQYIQNRIDKLGDP